MRTQVRIGDMYDYLTRCEGCGALISKSEADEVECYCELHDIDLSDLVICLNCLHEKN